MKQTRSVQQIKTEWLILRIQDGDETALSELVSCWSTRLTLHCQRLCDSAEECEDAIQETWIAAMRKLGTLQDPSNFSAWILRIASNKCADLIRKKKQFRRQDERLTEEQRTQPKEQPATQQDGMTASEEAEIIRQAIATLKPQFQEILSLHYQEEMPLQVISEQLNLPLNTVKSRLYHARKHLKNTLEELLP